LTPRRKVGRNCVGGERREVQSTIPKVAGSGRDGGVYFEVGGLKTSARGASW